MARDLNDDQDAYYALRRLPEQFYVSRRFRDGGGNAEPDAPWCRIAYHVCDLDGEVIFESDNAWELTVRETATRQQLKAFFFEDSRRIGHLAFQRFSSDGRTRNRERFTLSGNEVSNFTAFLALITSSAQFVDDNEGVRLGQHAVQELLKQENLRRTVYETYRDALVQLFEADVRSPEITALARRRHQVDEFERMLTSPEYFEGLRWHVDGGSPVGGERVWQEFFERNRWIFGTGLAPQFLHAWDPSGLEQVVVGASAFGPGKRADGLLRTAGALSALVFVEIKKHSTSLLHSEYRSGAWRISDEVAGGVAQCQSEVDMTVAALGRYVVREDDGLSTNEWTAVCRPRSLLVVGSLDEFLEGEHRYVGKLESFERFRRSLSDPEIITFDELFARARMAVTMSEASEEPEGPAAVAATEDAG